MNTQDKKIIKEFLTHFNYNVMHESTPDFLESYFLVVPKEDIHNPLLKEVFDLYVKKFPLLNISKATKNYMQEHEEILYFIFLNNIAHTDSLFEERSGFIQDNFKNILSYKIIGEAVNIGEHLENHIDIYLGKLKYVSSSTSIVAKEIAIKKIQEGKQKINTIWNKIR